MKTIFIAIFQGAEGKNILRTDVFKSLLADPEVRIVFFVGSDDKKLYYQKEFIHPRVIYEVFSQFKKPRFHGLFEYFKFRLLNNQTIDLRRRRALSMSGNYFSYGLSFLVTRLLGHRWFRKFIRRLDYLVVKDANFADYFISYKPNLVFLAHLFGEIEVSLLRAAKKRGISSVGLINSWDKLSGRAMMRLLPDHLLVFNEILKAEALEYADMDAKDITIVGIPQYDYYVTETPSTREEFCNRVGLDPRKKIIVYAPLGKSNSDSDWEVIDMLESFVERNLISQPAELLVRFPPNDFVDEQELKRRPWLKYDIPGIRFGRKRGFGLEWDMPPYDLKHLLNTLYHADCFVSYGSTLIIDAAIFDKPVININFEVKPSEPFHLMPTTFYLTEHYQKALSTGGVRLVNTKKELLTQINDYLNQPGLDQTGRRRLTQEQCFRLDGLSGRRVARFLLKVLKK